MQVYDRAVHALWLDQSLNKQCRRDWGCRDVLPKFIPHWCATGYFSVKVIGCDSFNQIVDGVALLGRFDDDGSVHNAEVKFYAFTQVHFFGDVLGDANSKAVSPFCNDG